MAPLDSRGEGGPKLQISLTDDTCDVIMITVCGAPAIHRGNWVCPSGVIKSNVIRVVSYI